MYHWRGGKCRYLYAREHISCTFGNNRSMFHWSASPYHTATIMRHSYTHLILLPVNPHFISIQGLPCCDHRPRLPCNNTNDCQSLKKTINLSVQMSINYIGELHSLRQIYELINACVCAGQLRPVMRCWLKYINTHTNS